MKIGPHVFDGRAALAPMAGVTDQPFRQLCRQLGAGYVPSEMLTSDVRLWNSKKSQRRLDHSGEPSPRIVQIAGAEPAMMAEAARENVRRGAQIVDINFGCPAKKVCNRAAGSALLRDEALVERILNAVVDAAGVPVTLKMRTGWSPEARNGVCIAQLAERCGVQAIAVHGRTRACMFRGHAEYDTIRSIKQAVTIPVIANGDVRTPQEARAVLDYTGADAIMIGRAAQGRPWIFREVEHFLKNGTEIAPPSGGEVHAIMHAHLRNLYAFYGEYTGVRVARKHLSWYCKERTDAREFRNLVVRVESSAEQLRLLDKYLGRAGGMRRAA